MSVAKNLQEVILLGEFDPIQTKLVWKTRFRLDLMFKHATTPWGRHSSIHIELR